MYVLLRAVVFRKRCDKIKLFSYQKFGNKYLAHLGD
jgi:hypothetical protein